MKEPFRSKKLKEFDIVIHHKAVNLHLNINFISDSESSITTNDIEKNQIVIATYFKTSRRSSVKFNVSPIKHKLDSSRTMDNIRRTESDDKKNYLEEIISFENLKYDEKKLTSFFLQLNNKISNCELRNSFLLLKNFSKFAATIETLLFETNVHPIDNHSKKYSLIGKLQRENGLLIIKAKGNTEIEPLILSSSRFKDLSIEKFDIQAHSFCIFKNGVLPSSNQSAKETKNDSLNPSEHLDKMNQSAVSIDLRFSNEEDYGDVRRKSLVSSKPSEKRETPSSGINKSRLGLDTLSKIRRGSNNSMFSFSSMAEVEGRIEARIDSISHSRRQSGLSLYNSKEKVESLQETSGFSKGMVVETAKFLPNHDATSSAIDINANSRKNSLLNRDKITRTFSENVFFKKTDTLVSKRRSSQMNMPYQIIIKSVNDGLIIPNFSEIQESAMITQEEPKIKRHNERKDLYNPQFDDISSPKLNDNTGEFTRAITYLRKLTSLDDMKPSLYSPLKKSSQPHKLNSSHSLSSSSMKETEYQQKSNSKSNKSEKKENSSLEKSVKEKNKDSKPVSVEFNVKIESPLKLKNFRKEKSLKLVTNPVKKPESFEEELKMVKEYSKNPPDIRAIKKEKSQSKKSPRKKKRGNLPQSTKDIILVARDSSRHMNKLATLKSPTTISKAFFDAEEAKERENLNANEIHFTTLDQSRNSRRTITDIQRRNSSLQIQNNLAQGNN